MDEKRLVAVRAAIAVTAVSRTLAGFGNGRTADKVDGAALAWCLACKHYTLEQGASLAHIPESPVKHRDLRGHSDAHRCCRKPLMESALVRVGVRY